MKGYQCDGGCGGFFTDRPSAILNYWPAAIAPGDAPPPQREAHLCAECSVPLAIELGLEDGEQVAGESSPFDDAVDEVDDDLDAYVAEVTL